MTETISVADIVVKKYFWLADEIIESDEDIL
jgi:hypothetical protein